MGLQVPEGPLCVRTGGGAVLQVGGDGENHAGGAAQGNDERSLQGQ